MDSAFADTSRAGMLRATQLGLLLELRELSRVPEQEIHDEGDLTWIVGGLGALHVTATRLAAGVAAARIDAIVGEAARRTLPISWWLDPEATPAGIGRLLASRGLALEDADLGMALDLASFRAPPMPEGLAIETVGVGVAVETFLALAGRLFAWPPSVAEGRRRRIEHDRRPEQPRIHYVALLGRTPVACSTLYVGDGLAVIGGVATEPAVRRRGIGAAVTAACLIEAARRGCRVATLQATVLGRSMYAGLGFVPTGTFERWVTPGAPPMAVETPIADPGLDPGAAR